MAADDAGPEAAGGSGEAAGGPGEAAGGHGPGVTWLAARMGCSPEELLADPPRLLAALADTEHAMSDLAARLRSTDPEVRASAEREADLLRRRFVTGTDAATTFRRTVITALRDASARLRAPDAPAPADPPPAE